MKTGLGRYKPHIATGGAFSPSDIAGLVAWYDASDTATITASSNSVSQWNDKSGNGYHLTQGTGSLQPLSGTRTLNGKNVIDYDGGDVLRRTGISAIGGNAHTFFGVFRWETGSANFARVFTTSAGGNDHDNSSSIIAIIRQNGGNWGLWYNTAARAGQAVSQDTDVVLTTQRNGDGSSAWLNGGSAATSSGLGTSNLAVTAIHSGLDPTNDVGNSGFNGYVAELIWYSSALGTTDRQSVRDYLNTKWAVY